MSRCAGRENKTAMKAWKKNAETWQFLGLMVLRAMTMWCEGGSANGLKRPWTTRV